MSIKVIDDIDRQLLKGILEADPVQVRKLYDNYLPGVIRYIKDNNGSESDARDIFQEAVIVIFKKVRDQSLNLDVPLQSFLFAICRNMWLSQLRSKRSRKIQKPVADILDLDTDTLQKIDQAQMESIFSRHLLVIGEKCREILLSFFNKIPMKEIAEKYNSSESYIKKRKHLCKEKLVESIQNDPLYKEMTS